MQAYFLIVSGRVQGVGFRWFTEREALKRDVRGYVRNLKDGRVEILAQAEESALEEFQARVRRGPSASRVDHVECLPTEIDLDLSTFRVRS